MNDRLGAAPKAPWHLWAMGILGLLWNGGGGGQNYLAVKFATPEFFAQQAEAIGAPTEAVEAFFANYPLWADVAYGLGVWGAVAGSLLLLLRSRFASLAFFLSLAGFLAGLVYQAMNPIEGMQNYAFVWGFSAVIGLTIILQWYYAARMTRAGVLR